MSMTIGGLGGCPPGFASRPEPQAMATTLLNQLDAGGKGYLDESDLSAALEALDGAGLETGSDATRLMAALDSDDDGRIGSSELEASLQRLAADLMGHADRMRMGPPPDQGLDVEALADMADALSGSDPGRAEDLARLVEDFAMADEDGDGLLTRAEARAYLADSGEETSRQGNQSQGASDPVMRQLLALARVYALGEGLEGSGGFSTVA